MEKNDLKRTPLYKTHLEAGARLVEFGGWEMPVQYTGIVDEHLAVRNRAGLFDVSHMGEFEFSGPGAAPLLQHLCCNNLEKLDVGKAQYSMFLNPTGGTVDDIMIYRTGESKYLVVVNASNVEKDWVHVQASSEDFDGVDILNRSEEFALLALQGPDAAGRLGELASCDVSAMPFRAVLTTEIAGTSSIVSTTGYTGENGFEIFVDANKGEEIWNAILEADEGGCVSPAGLGARDTLRLEASLPLYGHELDEETSPIEAGLGMFVAKKRDYVGSEASAKLRREGIPRKLATLEMIDKGIPRQGYPVSLEDGTEIGQVTSGSVAPFFNKNIAMAYVSTEFATPGQELMVNIRNRALAARVVSRPYYNRPKK